MTRQFRVAACVMPLLAGACGTGFEIDGPVTGLVVRGVVEDGGGLPVAGAVVRVSWWTAGCDAFSIIPASDTTVSTGEFETMVSEFGDFTQACVRVDAEPPPALGLEGAGAQFASVSLKPNGLDTLFVRLTLTAR